jgi:hypothetical protein
MNHENSNSSDSQSDDEARIANGELSPFSCSNCRRGHRKCDRLLPNCTECASKRKKCLYEEPQKRGPKGKAAKSNLYQPYPTPNASSVPQFGMPANLLPGGYDQLLLSQMTPNHERERELIRRYLVTQHLDLEFENISSFLPVLPPFHIKKILAYIRDNVCTGKTLTDTDSPPPTNAELALVFAIEGMDHLQQLTHSRFIHNSRTHPYCTTSL